MTERIKHYLGIVLGLIVLGGVVFAVVAPHKVTAPTPEQTTDESLPEGAWATDIVEDVVLAEEGKHYAIGVTYPKLRNSAATDYLKVFAEEQIATFKAESVPESLPEDTFQQVYTLSVSYDVVRSTTVDTFIFLIATDTGGAHGLQATKTFSFTREGALLSIGDLFTTGPQGLKTIAPYVIETLNEGEFVIPEWIAEGAAATEENYQSFVITNDGIEVIFDPYQVAPYAAGTVRISVPLSVFKTIANTKIFTQ